MSSAPRSGCKSSRMASSRRSTRSGAARRVRSWRSDADRVGTTGRRPARAHACPKPRGDHHGRQRALGARARLAATGGAPGRHGEHAPHHRELCALRRAGPDAVRVLDRELAAPARGGGGTAAHPERGHRPRDRGPPEDVTEELFASYLHTAGVPDPDLIIRTAGEMRLSNFLLWQAAYAEYWSTPTQWPDFGEEELYRALCAYGQRQRRFGRV